MNYFNLFPKPTLTSSIPIRTNQNRESSSVLDIFDVSRDDPFEKAQLNSIDEKELLAQVFPPSHNNNNKESKFFELLILEILISQLN